MALTAREAKMMIEAYPPRYYEGRSDWGYLVWYIEEWSPFSERYEVTGRATDEESAKAKHAEALVRHAEVLAAYSARAASE